MEEDWAQNLITSSNLPPSPVSTIFFKQADTQNSATKSIVQLFTGCEYICTSVCRPSVRTCHGMSGVRGKSIIDRNLGQQGWLA